MDIQNDRLVGITDFLSQISRGYDHDVMFELREACGRVSEFLRAVIDTNEFPNDTDRLMAMMNSYDTAHRVYTALEASAQENSTNNLNH